MISLIVAMDKNRAIGRQGKLPWRQTADLANFKKVTSGHPVIMGRKTFESIGRALPDRTNIVATRNPEWRATGALTTRSLTAAIALAEESGWPEIFVIGGGEIYSEAMPFADTMYVTEVSTEVLDADTFFPMIDTDVWQEIKRDDFPKDGRNEFGYSFVIYKRANPALGGTPKEGRENGE